MKVTKMSTTKSPKKRPVQASDKSGDAPRKKYKKEDTEEPVEVSTPIKQPIVAPNGKVFYPCQYCSKMFPQKTTSITHMKKCPSKDPVLKVKAENQPQNGNNNNVDVDMLISKQKEDLDNSGSSTENKAPNNSGLQKPKINIMQNITVQQPVSTNLPANASIYDFDESDSKSEDSKGEFDSKSDDANNKRCKHCKTEFDNPLDLLRHNRDCHNFPRTILPPHEIEKYFDSPNRDFCPICEKPIKTRNFRSVFIKHLLIHTTGLTYECRVCKKKFRRQGHMRSHEKRHIVTKVNI